MAMRLEDQKGSFVGSDRSISIDPSDPSIVGTEVTMPSDEKFLEVSQNERDRLRKIHGTPLL